LHSISGLWLLGSYTGRCI